MVRPISHILQLIVLLNNNNSIISIYSMLTSINLQQHIYTENYKYKYKIV